MIDESLISRDCLFSRTQPPSRFALFRDPLPRRGRIQIVDLRYWHPELDARECRADHSAIITEHSESVNIFI
jgi:hypothetical protein